MKIMQFKLENEEEMLAFGGSLAAVTRPGMVIFLHGPLGAGKTTLTRGFLRGLGYKDKVKSPTYTLVEPYEVGHQHIYHFDLYRLNDAQELENIGIREYFAPHNICLIEWPEKGQSYLPQPDLICDITLTDQGRQVKLRSQSILGEKILRVLSLATPIE